MPVAVFSILSVLAYGLVLGLGVVFFRRYWLRVRRGPDESVEQRILDEIDQLDVQIQIANERLKRIEDGFLLGPEEDRRTRALNRGD